MIKNIRKILTITVFLIMSIALVGCGNNTKDNAGSGDSNSMSNVELFLTSRNNTISATEYEYEYEMNAKLQYKIGGLTGPWASAITSGYVMWDSEAEETNYLMERNASGLLLIDGTSYTFNKGNTMITQNLNTAKDFAIQESETIDPNFNFESRTFANILNTLEAEDIKSVTKASNNKYKISYNSSINVFKNFLFKVDTVFISDLISLLSENINNETSFSFGTEFDNSVTINNDKITAFEYKMQINVSNFTFSLDYSQDFINIGKNVNIVLPNLNNIIVNKDDIKNELSTINNALYLTKNQEFSKYDFNIKTAIDYGFSLDNIFGLAINSHSRGTATRKIVNDNIYFLNKLEVDSDYKNDNENITDYERYRAVLLDGSVYDAEDRIWPLSNKFAQLEDYNNYEIDDFYGLFSEKIFSDANNISIIKKTTQKNITSYDIGFSASAIRELLEYYNNVIRLDVNLVEEIKIYDIGENFIIKNLDFKINIDNFGKIFNIEINTKGYYVDTTGKPLKWSFKNQIDFEDISSYQIPVNISDIELK